MELSLSTAEKFGLAPLPDFKGPPEPEDAEYPLILTGSKSRYYLHSSYRWVGRLREKRPYPKCEIHPDTAEANGIGEGDDVRVETRYGAITQKAHLTDRMHPEVVNASHGWWFPESAPAGQYDWRSANYNMLTSTGRLGKEYGTPNLKGIPCRVGPAQ